MDPTGNAGSAWAFGPKATAATQKNKLPHSKKSPIWMRPPKRDPKTGDVTGDYEYDEGAERTALQFAACAGLLAQKHFDTGQKIEYDADGHTERCTYKPLGRPYDGTPPDSAPKPPRSP